MPVFADTNDGEVNRRRRDFLAHALYHFHRIAITVKQVILPNSSFLEQALQKEFAKAGRMRDGQADVFV